MAQLRVREPFNFWTHALGCAVFLTADFVLCLSASTLTGRTVLACYGLCVGAMLASSALYHFAEDGQERLRRLDHFAIAVAIFGTYIPLSSLTWSRGGNVMLLVEAGLLCLAAFDAFAAKRIPGLRIVVYAVMGWLAAFFLPLLTGTLGWPVTRWIIAGGLVYTLGLVVYGIKKPDPWPGQVGFHGVWHLFVLAGVACHFVAMILIAGRL